jgi:hypothetical protein
VHRSGLWCGARGQVAACWAAAHTGQVGAGLLLQNRSRRRGCLEWCLAKLGVPFCRSLSLWVTAFLCCL